MGHRKINRKKIFEKASDGQYFLYKIKFPSTMHNEFQLNYNIHPVFSKKLN